MSNWENIELGSVCEVVRGGSPRPIINYITNDQDGVNWLKIGDVKETDKYFTHAAERIKRSGIPKTREVQAGDLILSNSMSFGRAFITLIDGYIHDGWLRLRCNEERLNKEYLYYFLTSDLAQNQFKAVATGSVVNNLKSDTVKAVRIKLPSLREQKSIASVLSIIDDKIKCNEEINDNLEQQAYALYIATIENSEQSVPLSEYVNIKHGYAFKGEYISTENNNTVLVTPGNFKIGGGFQENKCKYFMSDYPEEYVLHPGDLIVTMTDLSKDADTLGYGAIIPDNPGRIYLHNQRIGLVQFKRYSLCKDYIYWYLRSFDYHMRIVGSASGSTVKHTSPGRILEQCIPLPKDSDIMNLYALQVIDNMIAKNDLENQKLAKIRDALLPRLMSGEIDVSNIAV